VWPPITTGWSGYSPAVSTDSGGSVASRPAALREKAARSVPELVEALESAGFHVLVVTSLFARVVWLIVAMRPLRHLPFETER
jgi:hypothetical protein